MKPRNTKKGHEVDLLLATVGGSPRPVAWSLANCRPRRAVFFCSEDSRKQVQGGQDGEGTLLDLAKEFGFELQPDSTRLVIVDHQDFTRCVTVMRQEVAAAAKQAGSHASIVADLTGGTKVMSASLALACQRLKVNFNYVAASKLSDGSGREARTKEGLGVTQDGFEISRMCENPWNEMGFAAVDQALLHFNRNHFEAARDTLETQRCHVTDQRVRKKLDALAHLAEAYGHWDAFRHEEALERMELVLRDWNLIRLHLEAPNAAEIQALVQMHEKWLRRIAAGAASAELLLDLVANADRRAHDGHFEDALLRLYRAAELAAHIRLREGYGIADPSDVPFELLPETYRQEFGLLRAPREGRRVELSLQRAYSLLLHLGDELGERFVELSLDSERSGDSRSNSPLTYRNVSLLTHGHRRSTSGDVKRLRKKVMYLLQITEQSLPVFPKL